MFCSAEWGKQSLDFVLLRCESTARGEGRNLRLRQKRGITMCGVTDLYLQPYLW